MLSKFIKTSLYIHGNTSKISKIKNPLIRKACLTLRGSAWCLSHLDYFTSKGKYFPKFELLLSRRCPLPCKCCIHFMQDYKDNTFEPAEQIIADLNKFFSVVKWVDELKISGGDAFLYPQLDEVVKYLLSNKKIGKVIITSTGAVSPNEEIIKLLSNDKLQIDVEDYGKYSDKINEFKLLNSSNIKIKAYNEWQDFGNEERRNRNEEFLSQQYEKCNDERYCLLNGKIYACPRSAHGENLGYFKNNSNEFVDLRKSTEVLKEIKVLREVKYLTACDHCNSCTDEFKTYDLNCRFKTKGDQL